MNNGIGNLSKFLKIGKDAAADYSSGGEVAPARSGGTESLDSWLDDADPKVALATLLRYGRLAELFQSATDVGAGRMARYRDYDSMGNSSLIKSYLEMLTDDATQRNDETDRTIWPAEDCPHAEEVERFFDEIELEERVWGWAYSMAHYGDAFLKPVYSRDANVGIERVRDDYHPAEVWRIEVDGKLLGFAYNDAPTSMVGSHDFQASSMPSKIVDADSFVHLRFNYRPTSDRIKLRIPRSAVSDALGTRNGPSGDDGVDRNWVGKLVDALKRSGRVVTESGSDGLGPSEDDEIPVSGVDYDGDDITAVVSASYGRSAADNARKDYKILNLVEQSLALARLSRSPVSRVFYVNATGANVRERQEMMDYVERKFTMMESFDADRELYRDSYTPLGWSDDIVLPVSGEKGDVTVDTIGGDVDVKSIVDIDYFLSKVFSSLRVPKSFMGYEEALPGLSAEKSLTLLDIRYARTAKKDQRSLLNGIKQLVVLHFKYKFGKEYSVGDIKLNMLPISSAEDLQRMEILTNKLDLVDTIADSIGKAGGNQEVALKDMLKQLSSDFSIVDFREEWFTAGGEEPDSEEEDGSEGGLEMDFDLGGGPEEPPPAEEPEEPETGPETGPELEPPPGEGPGA